MAVWQALRGWRGRPVIAVVLVSGALAAAAFASANNLLFLIAAHWIGLLLASILFARLNLAGLRVECHLPEHAAAGHPAAIQIILTNEKRLIPSVALNVRLLWPGAEQQPAFFPWVAPGHRVEASISLTYPRRGRFTQHAFEISSGFPLGFTQQRARWAITSDCLVYPSLTGDASARTLLDQVFSELETRRQAYEMDFHRIRPYQFPESARHVDWKATAHTGELQVREFAQQDPLVEIVLDLAVTAQEESWFEQAVNRCAFLIWHLARREIRVRFWTQEWDVLVPDEAGVHDVLHYLALVQPRSLQARPSPSASVSCRVIFSPQAAKFATSNSVHPLMV